MQRQRWQGADPTEHVPYITMSARTSSRDTPARAAPAMPPAGPLAVICTAAITKENNMALKPHIPIERPRVGNMEATLNRFDYLKVGPSLPRLPALYPLHLAFPAPRSTGAAALFQSYRPPFIVVSHTVQAGVLPPKTLDLLPSSTSRPKVCSRLWLVSG
jgi:hypothetical protein